MNSRDTAMMNQLTFCFTIFNFSHLISILISGTLFITLILYSSTCFIHTKIQLIALFYTNNNNNDKQ